MTYPRLELYDTTMPRVRLSAEVTPGGEVSIWIRDESILFTWLDEIKERTS